MKTASVIAMLTLFPFSISAQAEVVTEKMPAWCENADDLIFDQKVPSPHTDILLSWSVQHMGGGNNLAWFNAGENTDIALAKNTEHVSLISDASHYDYRAKYFGSVRKGDIVLMRNRQTGYYAALKVDGIWRAPQGKCPLQDVTMEAQWYLQTDGSADFSTAPR